MWLEIKNGRYDEEHQDDDQLYILNTNTGVLHTKECADRDAEDGGVRNGHKKHFNDLDNARNDDSYKKDHDDCLG